MKKPPKTCELSAPSGDASPPLPLRHTLPARNVPRLWRQRAGDPSPDFIADSEIRRPVAGASARTGLEDEFGFQPTRVPLSSIGNFLRNPFYYGVFLHKGEMHQGIHAPMISKKTFDEIQTALVSVGKPRKKKDDKGFLFLNFATCATCGRCITGERHSKKSGRRYHYYRCSYKNKRPHADDASMIREESFAQEVRRNVSLVAIPDEWKEKFLAQIEIWENDDMRERQQQVDTISSKLTELKLKIDRINTAFTDGSIDLTEFKELKNPMIVQKTILEQNLAKAKKGETSPIEPLKNHILEANQAQKWVFENNLLEMKSFLQKIGLNRQFRSLTLTVTFKKPFDLLAQTTVAANLAASENERNSIWWRRRELNPRPKSTCQPRLHAYSG